MRLSFTCILNLVLCFTCVYTGLTLLVLLGCDYYDHIQKDQCKNNSRPKLQDVCEYSVNTRIHKKKCNARIFPRIESVAQSYVTHIPLHTEPRNSLVAVAAYDIAALPIKMPFDPSVFDSCIFFRQRLRPEDPKNFFV